MLVISCPAAVAWNKYEENSDIAKNTNTSTGACFVKMDISRKRRGVL